MNDKAQNLLNLYMEDSIDFRELMLLLEVGYITLKEYNTIIESKLIGTNVVDYMHNTSKGDIMVIK